MSQRLCLVVGLWATVFQLSAMPSIASAERSSVPVYCTNLLSEMAGALKDFDYCALSNSRPFKVCLKCAPVYARAASLFGNFLSGHSELSANCSMLIDGGKLSLVSESFRHIKETWVTLGACKECYEPDSYNVSADVKKFFEKHQSMEKCLDSADEQNKTCVHCRPEFVDLSKFFNKFLHSETELRHPLCLDVLDAMNETRHEWANMCFSQTYRMTTDVLVAIVMMFVFTAAFYLIVRFSQNPKDIELARVSTFQSIKLEENDSGIEQLYENYLKNTSRSTGQFATDRKQTPQPPSAVPEHSINFG